MTPRLKELFLKEIQPTLKSQLGLKNIYMGPKIEKIVLNMGLGLDGNDSKILKSCEEDMARKTWCVELRHDDNLQNETKPTFGDSYSG